MLFLECTTSLKSLWGCNWSKNLNNELFRQILGSNFDGIDISSRSNDELLCLAISALQAFVQGNFVGPMLNEEDEFKEHSLHFDLGCIQGSESIQNYLMSDGEEINTNSNHPELLAVAKYIFSHINLNLENITDPVEKFVCLHWLLRYYGVHQLVIDEFTDTLFNGINKVSDGLVELFTDIENIDNDSKVICLLEITTWQLHYKRVFTAKEKLQMAQQLLNVNITIEGKLGVRTKYQQKPLPQLMLRVDSPNGDVVELPSIESPVAPVKLPALLQLDDDVRLEKIQFINEEDNVITKTKGIVQALILGTL